MTYANLQRPARFGSLRRLKIPFFRRPLSAIFNDVGFQREGGGSEPRVPKPILARLSTGEYEFVLARCCFLRAHLA
jgi:hypothetical protein